MSASEMDSLQHVVDISPKPSVFFARSLEASRHEMAGLTQSLALCSLFIFLTIAVMLLIAIYYICKFHYTNLALERHLAETEARIERRRETENTISYGRCEKIENELREDINDLCECSSIPQIMLQTQEELPPDYSDLESARASPLPSYDDVAYCDQLNRSFQNLLSAR